MGVVKEKMTTQFIGRSETLTKDILQRLFRTIDVEEQCPIQKLISEADYNELDEIYQKHKFDFVVKYINMETFENITLAIEVNYHHTAGIQRKWNNVFVKLLKKYNVIPVPIDDWDCRHLFTLKKDKQHKLVWDDFKDVIDALEKSKVNP